MDLSYTWNQLVLKHSPATLEFAGSGIVQLVFFWGLSIIYISLPYILPTFSARHKLQKQEKQPTLAELRDCFTIVLRNQVFSMALHLSLLKLAALSGKPPSYRFDATLPSILEVIRDVTFGVFLREILFYYTHRFFHLPKIYSTIHKPHHRFTAPVALAAQYATLTEHIISNILPISLPLTIVRSHIVSFWVFLALELTETTTVHSGYDFFAGSAKKHDLHHEKFMMNFGTFGLLDWLHGTDGSRKVEKSN